MIIPKKNIRNALVVINTVHFLLSNWLNSFKSVEEIFEIDNKFPSIYRLSPKQKKEFNQILKELEEE